MSSCRYFKVSIVKIVSYITTHLLIFFTPIIISAISYAGMTQEQKQYLHRIKFDRLSDITGQYDECDINAWFLYLEKHLNDPSHFFGNK